MSAFYWIKLFHEIIDDPKMAMLPDRLWRRTIELFLLAGRQNKNGLLPETQQLAWALRIPPQDLQQELEQLVDTGIIQRLPAGWLVTNYEKRQSPSPAVARKRLQRTRDASQPGHVDVTNMSRNVTQNVTQNRTDTDTESESEEESDSVDSAYCYPTNPAEAMSDPSMQLFLEATGVFPPQAEYRNTVDTVLLLQKRHPERAELIDYLKRFWLSWKSRKNKSGNSYPSSNLTWLYEWAVNGEIPPENKPIPPPDPALDKLSRQQHALYGT